MRVQSTKTPSSRTLVYYFASVFISTWTFQITAVAISTGSEPDNPYVITLILLGSICPSLVGFIFVLREGGKTEVLRLLGRGLQARAAVYVYLFVLTVPVFVSGVAAHLAGNEIGGLNVPRLIGTFFIYFLFGGSVGEEFGWRGYALPRLFEHFNPFLASLVLGIVWSVWHLPLFWLTGTSQNETPFTLFIVGTTSLSFVYTWVFLKSNNSLFLCLLFHTAVNWTVAIFPIQPVNGIDSRIYHETGIQALLAFTIIAANFRMFTRKGYP